MKFLSEFFRKFLIFGELWSFMKERKKWWLLPILFLLVLLGILLIFAESSFLGPFIYTLF